MTGTLGGQDARVVLARVAQSRKDLGTWNHTSSGAHAPVNFGRLVFTDTPLTLTPAWQLHTVEPGLNEYTLALNLSNEHKPPYLVWSHLTCSDQQVAIAQTLLAYSATKVSHQFNASVAGPVTLRWGVMNAATLEPVYVSLAIHTTVQSSVTFVILFDLALVMHLIHSVDWHSTLRCAYAGSMR